MALGKYLIYASFILFFIILALQYFLRIKIAAFLQSKDTLVTGRIIGNKFGTLRLYCLSIPFWGFAIGISLQNNPSALLIMAVLSIMIGVLSYLKYKTELTIDSDYINIKELFNVKKIPISDISSVNFEYLINTYSRCLVITLRNGMQLEYDQDEYWGLSWFYKTLQDKIHTKSDSSL